MTSLTPTPESPLLVDLAFRSRESSKRNNAKETKDIYLVLHKDLKTSVNLYNPQPPPTDSQINTKGGIKKENNKVIRRPREIYRPTPLGKVYHRIILTQDVNPSFVFNTHCLNL